MAEKSFPNFAYPRALTILQEASVVLSQVMSLDQLSPEAQDNIRLLATRLRARCGEAIIAFGPQIETRVELQLITTKPPDESIDPAVA